MVCVPLEDVLWCVYHWWACCGVCATGGCAVVCCRQAKDRFVRLKKERDYHRMNHRRVLQEKERLMGDLRRLQEHISHREDALLKMKTKYEVGRLLEGVSMRGGSTHAPCRAPCGRRHSWRLRQRREGQCSRAPQ